MQSFENNKLWAEILDSIKVTVSGAIFTTWFKQTHLASLKKSGGRYIAEVGCASSFIKSTIESRYFGLVQDTLIKSLSTQCDLLFIVKDNPDKSVKNDIPSPLFESFNADSKKTRDLSIKVGLRPGFNFENYAVSSSNQMAWAAAEAVAKELGHAYNPLFIWGGVGVGKTHLMNAVGFYAIEKGSAENIVFCTGEQFTNDIVEGIRNKSTLNVRNKYRKVDVLLIDDIQFIAGKDAVQEEFFHTFNSLVSNGAQIILTSDRPPSEISKLEERLKSRFEAGLLVDIAPPDFELRCAIAQIKARERNMDIPMDLIQVIAGNLDSARKIEGFLVKLFSEIKIKNKEISQDIVETLLGKGIDTNGVSTKASPNDIIQAISHHFSISKRVLLGKSRIRSIARPRQILMYILRTQLILPLDEVGQIVGGRDHTTVMHAVEKITQLASTNVQIREDIRGIKNLL
ncbi:chromosomal replication initiator protein DnaA [Candidatus Woesebacteria bacterium RIFCSPLOWO2_01_FULL_37_19]|uniref:Chromosomal replication initiator protein DnaA n=2 Tax=Candidatus Woeseibacteriota TaxID=1752722 RepID=A0A1F8AXY9_9BACT|nr:MAG: chromosomal replication initiator protein DnaA [Candidatus Woesebacteria bacterium RIFCSPHIGHO2_01_FULL_38_26b]OGM56607.1 MAG: chromosomal replication initiator protein DnaA [Candidatus Woesebacteria bacterium RIFCSPLOWO2_01_FULL_37_19]